jgi:glutamate synthase (NADPH/NADH) small chain
LENRLSILKAPATKSGRRVAVIGGGPAGLSCAAELAQLGHEVVVFEKKPKAGGLNTYGIACYKMMPEVSLAEVAMIQGLGVEFHCGVEVGRDLPVEQVQEEFDALFIGLGLGKGTRLNIPGEGLPEVVEALDFIEQIHTRPLHQVPVGDRVAVIGGGNTAIDAVTQARRLGARDAAIVYRRSQAEMPAYDFEQQLAKTDGARFLFSVVPLEILSDSTGHVTGLKLGRTASTNGKLQVLAGSEFTEPFDMVIKAIGEEKQVNLFKKLFPALELDKRGVVAQPRHGRDKHTGRVHRGRLRQWRRGSRQRRGRRQKGCPRHSRLLHRARNHRTSTSFASRGERPAGRVRLQPPDSCATIGGRICERTQSSISYMVA